MYLLDGRLDLKLSESLLWWGGRLRSNSTLRLRLEIDPKGRLALDSSAMLGLERRAEDNTMLPSVYADIYVDWLPKKGILLSLGYSFSNDLDLYRWNPVHTGLLRVAWSHRAP